MVIRQSRLHLADINGDPYAMQAIHDFVIATIDNDCKTIVEVGCGVGRLIADIAQAHSDVTCYGVDYSYQMLRQAQRYWLQGQSIEIRDQHLGYPTTIIPARTPLPRLGLLMADACDLPFDDGAINVVISSFTIDRLDDPLAAVREWYRILRPGGKMILATPLNWASASGWLRIPNGQALTDLLIDLNLLIKDHQQVLITEPIDARGNHVGWHTEVVMAEK